MFFSEFFIDFPKYIQGMNNKLLYAIIAIVFLPSLKVFSQEEDIEELLQEEIINTNPVYKPVIGLGSGVLNFYGDIRNNYINPVIGNYGYKFNVSTFLDQKRFYTLNLLFIYGQVSGNERSITDLSRNLNFQTELVTFGVNVEYNFDHLIKRNKNIRPYISAGIENIQFTPKGDLYDENDLFYHYWPDGTIRDIPSTSSDMNPSLILNRDYNYETDLRQRERDLYGLGAYSKNTFAIPVDIGLNFKVSERIYFKLGTSLHYTFTDFLDNVSYEGTSIKGKKGNDILSYNYFTLHFDLFSEPKTIIVEKMFAELDFDEVMLYDEDGDFVLDAVDECPGTPYGVEVDSLGCPLDADNDGIPDYLDEEKHSPPNAWVDENGVSISEEEYLARLKKRENALKRGDALTYFESYGEGYNRNRIEAIEEKIVEVEQAPAAEYNFFVIIGSFRNRDNAIRYQKIIKDKGFSSVLLRSDLGFYRVSVKATDDISIARTEIMRIRNQYPEHSDTWLLRRLR